MDYYAIGQRVRRFRKAKKLSQEELAEKIGISTTHMSHIETGNTKLSLSVLVELALALDVRADDLLFDLERTSTEMLSAEVSSILETCTLSEARIILDLVKAAKITLDKHY